MSTVQCVICSKDMPAVFGVPTQKSGWIIVGKACVCKECATICHIYNATDAMMYNTNSLLQKYVTMSRRLSCIICKSPFSRDQLGYPDNNESFELSDQNRVCKECAAKCNVFTETDAQEFDTRSFREKYKSIIQNESQTDNDEKQEEDETPEGEVGENIPLVEASADDIIKSLKLEGTKYEQEVFLLFKMADDMLQRVTDWEGLKFLIKIPLNNPSIMDKYYFSKSNLENIMRSVIIAESNGTDITCGKYARTLDDVLVCNLDTLEQYKNRLTTDEEKQYFEKIDNYLFHILYPDHYEEWSEISSFYEGYADELKDQLGWINEFALSRAFDISVELSYIILSRIEKNELYGFSKSKLYKIYEKPKNMPHCNIDELQAVIDEYKTKRFNQTSINLYRRFIDPDYQLSSVSSSPQIDESLTSKDKGIAFEEYCADLLRKNGFTNVELTKASGDHGVDVLADNMDTSYAIQCKYYTGAVGNFAVQEAYTGKSFYNRDVAVVMTNSTFTTQAIEEAKALRVKLWDGNKIKEMFGEEE